MARHRYKVTVYARRVTDLDCVVEVEADTVANAKAQVALMISTDQIKDSQLEEAGSYIAGMEVGDVEKIRP